ncbi:MAG TPA: alternative ribosome rescue aminoacyl-tRNA hydrolase ArfB [Gammaproteobacteria bacterium]|nr:alternative ribosome rescue aminoacyl-tRNA hydrolase ArfB [Gammaproteobacteria bacterium]
MLRITSRIVLDENEIEFRFVRASGPGGQNVNKVATAAELRFDVSGNKSLPDTVRQRLFALAGNRISREGILVISAQRFRTQERNRADALERLTGLLQRAAMPPKKRIATKPTKASKRRRLEGKRQLATKKRLRRDNRDE